MVFCVNVFSAQQLLVSATNDEDKEVTKLYLELDQYNDIVSITKQTVLHGKVSASENFITKDGANDFVLVKMKGRNILSLGSSNFSSHNGGNISLIFLYSGITSTFKSLDVDLARDGDTWSLYLNGRRLNHLHMVSHKKMLLGVVGIKRIDIIK